MRVLFAGGRLQGAAATWFPENGGSAFPVVIATTGGECYGLGQPLAGIKPQDELIYFVENFDPKHPTLARNQVIERLGDLLPPEVVGHLIAALHPIQQHIDALGRQVAADQMRIAQLEAKLRASESAEAKGS